MNATKSTAKMNSPLVLTKSMLEAATPPFKSYSSVQSQSELVRSLHESIEEKRQERLGNVRVNVEMEDAIENGVRFVRMWLWLPSFAMR